MTLRLSIKRDPSRRFLRSGIPSATQHEETPKAPVRAQGTTQDTKSAWAMRQGATDEWATDGSQRR